MHSSNPSFNTDPPLFFDSGLTLGTQSSMYQPYPDAEANNWISATMRQPSPPPVFSWPSIPIPFGYHDVQQPSPADGIVFPSYPIMNPPPQTGSFSHGEWPQNLAGIHPYADHGPYNQQRDSVPQRDDQIPLQQSPGQYQEPVTPQCIAEHSGASVAEAPTTETNSLDSLCSEDKFLLDCRLKGMKWKPITAEYKKKWEKKTTSALRSKFWRLRREHPNISQMTKPGSRKGSKRL